MTLSQIHRPLLAVALLVSACPAAAHERPSTAPAARFLQATIDAALPLAMPPVSQSADSRLRGIMDAALDFRDLTLFALGRYRADLDDDASARAEDAIGHQLRVLAYRAGAAYPTLAMTVGSLRIDPDGNRHVQSMARLPRIGDVEVEWVLKPLGASYRIVDIQAFGLTLRHFLRDWVAILVAGQDPAAVFGPPGAASPQ